jgi:glyoxylase-like metal-dependent hydrolase (beta-lactamase superfamily II)
MTPRSAANAEAEADAAAALARAADAGIHCMAIPTPFRVGRVNTYLVDDDPLTLVDSGPNSGTALDALERALAAHGRRVEELGLIVISHQHIDHLGLVSILARRSGADVAALDLLAPWVEHWSEAMDADDAFAERMMAEHGIPEDVRHALVGVSQSYRGWGAAATVTRPLPDGCELRLRDRTLRVHHRPGHSPSDTIFHDAARRIVLGADHLIKHISSNPLISRPLTPASVRAADGGGGGGERAERPHALEIYMASLRATRAMTDVDLVLAGHGDPVTDHVALIDERFRLHARRAAKIGRLIADAGERGGVSAYEIAQSLWGNVAVTQAYLTLSEVLGHVDLLVGDGQVVERRDGGVVRFAAAG